MTNMQARIEAALDGENSIQVGVPYDLIPVIKRAAAMAGLAYHELTFPAGTSIDSFYDLLNDTFDFPTKAVNVQGALDWLGDLDWFGNNKGHVLVFDGLADLIKSHYGSFRGLVDMLPYAADRARSAGHAFHAFLVGTSEVIVSKAIFDLNDANQHLENDGSTINPSYPVKILNYSTD